MIPVHLPSPTRVVVLCVYLCAGAAMAGSVTARQIPIDVVAPLLADDGSAYTSAHRVHAAEVAAGGPPPGWATQAQRNQLERLHPRRVVRMRATGHDPAVPRVPAADAWVFVEGHGEGAVRLARRLVAAGVERVWVVLPSRTGSRAQATHVARRSQP